MERFPVIVEVFGWDGVAQAAKQYHANEVGLALHPNASLRFATELVAALDTENKAGAFQLVNPEVARCKVEVYKCLLPHVTALSGWANNVSHDVVKVTDAVREMEAKFGDADRRNIFPDPPQDAPILEPLCQQETVYIVPRPGKTEPHLQRQRLTAEEKKGPPRTSPLPDGKAIQTAMYKTNLEFLQKKLIFLESLDEKLRVFSSEMADLLLMGSSAGSGRTVIDFLDVDTTGIKVRNKSRTATEACRTPEGNRSRTATEACRTPEGNKSGTPTVACRTPEGNKSGTPTVACKTPEGNKSRTPTKDRSPKAVVASAGEEVRKSTPGIQPKSCKTPDCTKSGKLSKRTSDGTPTKDQTLKDVKKAKYQKDGQSP